ncbi:hypothetical protein D1007_52891 [Hordeum vulgare]|nr:hypothetical protein D1007_52891 [Hordeum vulgare]
MACSNKFLMAPYTGHTHRLPDNATCVGSTDDWLALALGHQHTTHKGTKRRVVHSYVLQNPFSNTSLPLPELDAVLVHDMSLVRKFLMRSTVDDLIAVITNNTKHPLVVFRRGKGVWSPKPRPASPYV